MTIRWLLMTVLSTSSNTFCKWETERVSCGVPDLLDLGTYYFWCEMRGGVNMITIYNKTINQIYHAELKKWNDYGYRYAPDILREVDTDLSKKWDPMIDMYVMSQPELEEWRNFWRDEVGCARLGIASLLDRGDYQFDCSLDVGV